MDACTRSKQGLEKVGCQLQDDVTTIRNNEIKSPNWGEKDAISTEREKGWAGRATRSMGGFLGEESSQADESLAEEKMAPGRG